MLKRIKCKGFKSIREMDLELGRVNVFIGANGAGKSNFVELIRFLQYLNGQRLQYYVRKKGGASRVLHYGSEETDTIEIEFQFQWDVSMEVYRCTLAPTEDDSLFIREEEGWITSLDRISDKDNRFLENNRKESILAPAPFGTYATTEWNEVLHGNFTRFKTYHFNDTSPSSPLRKRSMHGLEHVVEEDGANLAGVLLFLKRAFPNDLRRIEDTVRIVAPFFEGFVLEAEVDNPRATLLRWRDSKHSFVFSAQDLPDGLLRFIALTTVLTLPDDFRGGAIAIDEPELGLHPHAVEVLGALIDKASMDSQIILATQSLNMLDQFELENVIVVERKDGASTFTRPDIASKEHWLEDYALSDIWYKNIIGGTP